MDGRRETKETAAAAAARVERIARVHRKLREKARWKMSEGGHKFKHFSRSFGPRDTVMARAARRARPFTSEYEVGLEVTRSRRRLKGKMLRILPGPATG